MTQTLWLDVLGVLGGEKSLAAYLSFLGTDELPVVEEEPDDDQMQFDYPEAA